MYRVTIYTTNTKRRYFLTKYFAIRYVKKHTGRADVVNLFMERLSWRVL